MKLAFKIGKTLVVQRWIRARRLQGRTSISRLVMKKGEVELFCETLGAVVEKGLDGSCIARRIGRLAVVRSAVFV